MSKKALNTYQFPMELQKEFYQLMRTKENFLQNLSNADRRKLITLYERLQDAWNQNRTENLKSSLEQKYQELRGIQRSIESDWSIFEKNIEEELLNDLNLKSMLLKQDEEILKKDEASFNSLQKVREKDIEQRQQSLDKKKTELKEKESFLTAQSKEKLALMAEMEARLTGEKQKLSEMQSEYESLSQERKEKSSQLQKKREDYQSGLDVWRKKREEKSKNLNAKKLDYQKSIDQTRSSLQESLKNFELESLKRLRHAIAQEAQGYPEELRSYLRNGNSSMLSRKLTTLTNGTKELGRALNRELTKAGLKEKDYFEKMDRNVVAV